MDNERIEEIKSELETTKVDLSRMKSEFTRFQEDFLKHEHDGYDGRKISQNNIMSKVRAVGSITMATTGRTYRLGLASSPTNIDFYGAAIHYNTGVFGSGTSTNVDIRATIIGSAQLGQGYNFQPSTTSSVVTGGLLQDVIQSSTSISVKISTSQVNTSVSEYHLVSVNFPTNAAADIVARATVTKFADEYVEVLATLAPGWGIVGNFVVS